ncbi:MAG TPA: hypothetical protein QF646_05105 [Candidatus Poseidoniales archaeon]|nr:hypothetical protein [Candidatus Poseidoniales archaeon]
MSLDPSPPVTPPEPGDIVLGRFQPFHLGHAGLLTSVLDAASPAIVMVAIGSANAGIGPNDPWSAAERQEMIEAWAEDEGHSDRLRFVHIPDINDPPNWVKHAEMYHGTSGVLHTSDASTESLYEESGWIIQRHELLNREDLVGWRVRETLKLTFAVPEVDAVQMILKESIPSAVIDWLSEEDRTKRLVLLEPNVERIA